MLRKLSVLLFAAALPFALTAAPAAAAEAAQVLTAPAAIQTPAEKELRVGLVLSGGGARGFAHVGVLRVLEKAGVKVHVITATSMGSMVGGGYAEGYSPEELATIVKSVDWTQMFASKTNQEDLNWRRKQDKQNGLSDTELGIGPKGFALPYGLISTRELDLFLARVNEPSSKTHSLDRLPVPFAAFATDLETGNAVKLQKDISLSEAMRASMSIPGAFAPAEWQGKLLVDGGLVQNLPVDAAREMGADVIIAVNVGTPLSPRNELDSIGGVMGQMLNILTEQNVQRSLKEITERDILITPDLSKYTSGDFNKSDEIMQVGEDAAMQVFEKLQALGVSQSEFGRWNTARRAPISADRMHRIAEVKVNGLKTVNPENVLKEVNIQPGETVSTAQVEESARRILQTDDFLSVPYHFEPGADGMEVLVLEPQEKTWGYSAFRFGGKVQTNFNDDNTFNFMLEHTLGWLNDWGGELKTAARIGENAGFSMQFYQPLGTASPFYLRPMISYQKESYDQYAGDTRSSTWQNRMFTATTELGYEFGRYGTISAGPGYYRVRNSRLVGRDGEGHSHGDSFGGFVKLNIDRLDSYSFPRKGYKLEAQYVRFADDMGTDSSKNNYMASGVGAMTLGSWSVQAAIKGGRASHEGAYKLGGAFNLTGSDYGRYAGDHMVFGRVMAYRSLSADLMKLGVPVWAGVSLEAGRAFNGADSDHPGWKKAASVFLGADTWIGPIYLVGGRTFGGSSGVYFVWGHIM